MEPSIGRKARVKRTSGVSEKQLVEKMDMARDDEFWYHDNRERLRKKYLNQWVAIRRKRVILVDTDRDRLIRKLRERSNGFVDSRVFLVTEQDIPHA